MAQRSNRRRDSLVKKVAFSGVDGTHLGQDKT